MTSDPNSKLCSRCKTVKPVQSFGLRMRNGKEYVQSPCKECSNELRRGRYGRSDKDKATRRRCQLRLRYGITPEQYDFMLQEQGGVCKICKEEDKNGTRLAVDHCHETGAVRGLLCLACNNMLGQVEKYKRNPSPWDQYLQEYSS
jgi:hypothetical protein